jgi:hypothetical protein
MGRYREITSLTVAKLPNRFRTPLAGSIVVYALIGVAAALIISVGALIALAGEMADGTPFAAALTAALWAAVGAGTATLVALLLIPFIRDGLGLAEDIRLLEAASPAHLSLIHI